MSRSALPLGELSAEQADTRISSAESVILITGISLYLILALFSAINKSAWCDEGWYGGPAHQLAFRGYMGTPNLYTIPYHETASYSSLPGVDKHTYWEMPGYIVALAAWMKLAGADLAAARMLNVFLGVVALALWYLFLKKIGWDGITAALAAALTGLDTFLLSDAAWLRADMLSLTLGIGAYVTYVALRRRYFAAALAAAFSCAVAAGLTHPNGGLLILIGLAVFLWRDRALLRPRHLLFIAAPFAAGALIWGAYILESPVDFIAQFSANSGGRFFEILHPLAAIRGECGRYLQAFGLGSTGATVPRAVILKSVVLIAYLTGALAFLITGFRRGAASSLRIPAAIFVGYLLFYIFFEGIRTTYYLIWIVPFYNAFVAWLALRWWHRAPAFRLGVLAALMAIVAIQSGVTIGKALRYPRLSSMRELANYLQASGGTDSRTIASSELGFVLGFDGRQYTDDETFGLASGIRPKRIVISPRYEVEILESPSTPAHAAARAYLKAHCSQSYDRNRYQVYECAP